MSSTDVTDTLNDVLIITGLNHGQITLRRRLLSDNGPCYVSNDLAEHLEMKNMENTRGKPYHSQTQGKIERWHRSLKNQILLEHYYLPGELKQRIQQFVDYYNHQLYHKSLNNLTPADVFYGHGEQILKQCEQIKINTLAMRKQNHYVNRFITLS